MPVEKISHREVARSSNKSLLGCGGRGGGSNKSLVTNQPKGVCV